MIIGVTGTDGAGKGAAVDFLVRKRSCQHFSSRSVIETEVHARGLEPTREHLRLVANDLRQKFGNDVLVARALERIAAEAVPCAVIESIRTLAEAETLRAAGGVLLAVDADPKERYRRISGRKSATDNITYEAFVAQEQIEMNDTDPHGMQKAAVMQSADHTIMNNGSMRTLWQKMNTFMRKYDDRS